MKSKPHFYHHLLDYGDVLNLMNQHDLSIEQKEELIHIIENTIHVEVIDLILTETPTDYHDQVLKHMDERPHDRGVLVLLNRLVENLDDKILGVVHKVKQEFINEFESYKEAAKEWFEGDDLLIRKGKERH